MTIGIYAIRNKINGKIYVGSSVNIELRWSQHKWNLNKGSHHSKHLQKAWEKYGAEAFEFAVIEEVLDCQELREAEQKSIDAHESYKRENGYNIASVVDRRTASTIPESERDGKSPRKYPQVSVSMYPLTQAILEKIQESTGKHQAAVLREALEIGLEQILAKHEKLLAAATSTQPLSHTLFHIGRQMYRDRQPMPDDRVLMLGWRFERDMQVELDERLMLVNSLSNLEDV